MDILHILRKTPDSDSQEMIAELSEDKKASSLQLYDPDIDWEDVVDLIFNHEQVVCW